MTVLEELEQKIVEAEADARRVLTKLEGLAELEGALGETNRTVLTAGAGLSRLADIIEQTAEEFKQALAAFREAARTIRETDPALLLQTISRVEARLESTQSLIVEAAQKLDRVGPDVGKAIGNFSEDIQRNIGDLLNNFAECQRSWFAENASNLKTIRLIAILGVVIAVSILGVNLYEHFGH
jgi:DNA repair exonuclease SbcCD ATPase subunit